MSEIDPVILELRADLEKYRSDIRRMTSEVTTRLGVQEASVKSLENQFKRSSDSIGNTARGLAASFGALFSGREVVGMIDSFTRLQNSLKVAGLEGQQLESVQESLLDLSKQYGVGIEGLANLYGKATDAGRSFGASEAQVLQLTEATSQALKITGTNAAQASGAILGLSQALASGTVRAEEYNQINEGGLRPLLQAAAGAERFGGDINKLRAAMLDGKVSSQEFFAGILAGSAELEGKASKATLTLSGAYEALTSSLTVYVGQSAQANGVTAALAGGLQTLAENLDSLATVLAVFATFLAGRYVGAMAAATAITLAKARADIILAAAARGAGTQLQFMGLQAAFTGRALLAAFGGPVGLAVTALTLGLGALALTSRDTSASLAELEGELAVAEGRLDDARKQAKAAGINVSDLGDQSGVAAGSINTFSDAVWASVNAMTSAASAAKELTLAKIALSNAEAKRTIAEVAPQARGAARQIREMRAKYGTNGKFEGIEDVNVMSEKLNVAAATIRANNETKAIINRLGSKFEEPGGNGSPGVSPVADDKKKVGAKGRTRAAEDVEAKIFRATQDELNAQIEVLRAKSQLALEAGERGELERDTSNIEAQLRENEIAEALRKKDITAEQAKVQRAHLAQLYGQVEAFDEERGIAVRAKQSLYGLVIARDERRQAEQEAAEIAEAETRAKSDALRDQYDLATTLDERRRIALAIIDLEDRSRLEALRLIQLDEDIYDAKTRRLAAIEEARIIDSRASREEQVKRANQGPLDRYIESTRDTKTRVEDAMVRELQSVNDGITDALTKQLGIKNQFVKDMFSIFLDEAIFKPLAESLRNRQSGGGGFLSSLLNIGASLLGSGSSGGLSTSNAGSGLKAGFKFPGRASGGYVGPGQVVRVNEHKGTGVELLRMGRQGGTVIPLGQVNQRAAQPAGQGAGVTTVRLELSGDIDARIIDVAGPVMVEVVRATADQISDAGAQKAIQQMTTPKM